jgi:hypothetical protein
MGTLLFGRHLFRRSNGPVLTTTTLDRCRGNEVDEHGAEIPVSPNRFRDWPANKFRPHEGPRTGYLFAAPATDIALGASGLSNRLRAVPRERSRSLGVPQSLAPRSDKHFTNRIMKRIRRAPWSHGEDERLKTLVASGASALRAAAAFKSSVSSIRARAWKRDPISIDTGSEKEAC